jgi:hypothetical protein
VIAMTAQIIQFPTRPVIPAPTDFCSDIEEARYMVARLRAQRDAFDPHSRKFMIEQIKLDWWMDELLRLSDAANDNIIPLRRA